MIAAVDRVLADIGATNLPSTRALQQDRRGRPAAPAASIRPGSRMRRRCRASAGEGPDAAPRARVAERFASSFETVGASVSLDEGAKLAELYALGAPIDEREDSEEGVLVRARLPQREVRRFARYLVADAGEGSAAERV